MLSGNGTLATFSCSYHVTENAFAQMIADALVANPPLLVLDDGSDDSTTEVLEPYARVADELAAREVATVSPAGSRQEAVEAAVVGTGVFEAALVALRRLAQEHPSARRFRRGRRR